MRVILAVETIKPLRWCIRDGYTWHIVRRVEIRTRMKSGTGMKSPHAYLYCDGKVTVKGGKAVISK